MAARAWQSLRVVFRNQSRVLSFLRDLQSHPTWTADSPDIHGIQTIANGLLAELAVVGERIDRELIYDTDVLIQQITNLITIDEGYRSRDQNSSVRRLSWITVRLQISEDLSTRADKYKVYIFTLGVSSCKCL